MSALVSSKEREIIRALSSKYGFSESDACRYIENMSSTESPTLHNPNHFVKNEYLTKLELTIHNILSRPEKKTLTYDMLDTDKTTQRNLIALKVKHRQMKKGEIWQEALGTYDGFINLKTGHLTGLDILSHSKKIAVELKSRTNTDNASSKKSNLDKLSAFKKDNPDYTCIYANINADTYEKTVEGMDKIIVHNGSEIRHMIGHKFIKFMLGEEVYLTVIDLMRNTMDNI